MTEARAIGQAQRNNAGRHGFWRRSWAMLVKEFIQLKRDRISFAMIIMIPLIQLLLFGYAINTNPRHLPTAVLMQEHSDLGRSILQGAAEHALLQRHPRRARRSRIRPASGIGHGPVRDRDSGQLRAGGAPRRSSGAADCGGRHRSGRLGLCDECAQSGRAHGAATRPRRSRGGGRRRSRSAPTPATIRPAKARSTSCRAWSAPSSP